MRKNIQKFLTEHGLFLIFLALAIFLRVANLRNVLYFTYDQGRDMMVLQRIAQGDPVLVGPTTGVQGVFLGPLWYYVGVPGFILFRGNPYGVALWYRLIGCFSLPLFWIFAHHLFKKKTWAFLCAVLLAFLPGSLQGTTFIWSPLLTVPLFVFFLLCLERSEKSLKWLFLSFLSLGFILQGEFAYGVFFIPVALALVPYVRKKIDVVAWIIALFAIGLTLVPQGVFELRNHFLITHALLSNMNKLGETVGYDWLLLNRPKQLLLSTSDVLFGQGEGMLAFTVIALFLALAGIAQIFKKNAKESFSPLWKLVGIFAITPYPFYMIWKGNWGRFFSYYITPHFVLLIPLMVLGLYWLWQQRLPDWLFPITLKRISMVIIGGFLGATLTFTTSLIFYVHNNAGLTIMATALERMYAWRNQDNAGRSTFRIYTPNILTEHYDYLSGWIAKEQHLEAPLTIKDASNIWYILYEPDVDHREKRFIPWYTEATSGGVLTRHDTVGILTIETWTDVGYAKTNHIQPYQAQP